MPPPFDDEQIFRCSTSVLEELTRVGKAEGLPGAEAAAVLLVALGRFYGRVGFRELDGAAAWESLCSAALRPIFLLGFNAERRRES